MLLFKPILFCLKITGCFSLITRTAEISSEGNANTANAIKEKAISNNLFILLPSIINECLPEYNIIASIAEYCKYSARKIS